MVDGLGGLPARAYVERMAKCSKLFCARTLGRLTVIFIHIENWVVSNFLIMKILYENSKKMDSYP
jgi:hypothetical protein